MENIYKFTIGLPDKYRFLISNATKKNKMTNSQFIVKLIDNTLTKSSSQFAIADRNLVDKVIVRLKYGHYNENQLSKIFEILSNSAQV